MGTGIYAILDLVAQAIIGGLYLQKHDAAAVRFFTDALSDPQTMLAKHPEDFQLVFLGFITDDNTIVPVRDDSGSRVVLSGKQWKLSQEPPPQRVTTENGRTTVHTPERIPGKTQFTIPAR